jgi:hypothetical protein
MNYETKNCSVENTRNYQSFRGQLLNLRNLNMFRTERPKRLLFHRTKNRSVRSCGTFEV